MTTRVRIISAWVLSLGACSDAEPAVQIALTSRASLEGLELRLRVVSSEVAENLADAADLTRTEWSVQRPRLRSVPVGRPVRIVVEARRGGHIELVGATPSLTLRPQESLRRSIELTPTPSFEAGRLLQPETGVTSNRPRRVLRVRGQGGTTIALGPTPNLEGAPRLPLEACDADGCRASFVLEPCGDGAALCTRQVYGRLFGERGYPSRIDQVDLVLDPRSPSLLPGGVSTSIRDEDGRVTAGLVALGLGSTAVVGLEFDEPVEASTARIESRNVPELEWSVVPARGAVASLVFETTLQTNLGATSLCPLAVQVTAPAGSPTALDLPLPQTCPFDVDLEAPAAIDARLVRALDPLDATEGRVVSFIETDVPLPTNHRLAVGIGDVELAVLQPDASGELGFPRGEVRAPGTEPLWTQVVDGAGNRSPRTTVTRERWVTRAGGSTRPYVVPRARPFLFAESSQPGRQVQDLQPLAATDGDSVTVEAERGVERWSRWVSEPPRLDSAELGVDRVRGVMVLHGGLTRNPAPDGTLREVGSDVWEFDGRSLRPVLLADPFVDAAANHWLVFDGARGELLFPATLPRSSQRMLRWTGTEVQLRSSGQIDFQQDLPARYDHRSGEVISVGPLAGGRVSEFVVSAWGGDGWTRQGTIFEIEDPFTSTDSAWTDWPDEHAVVIFGGQDFRDSQSNIAVPSDDTIVWRREGPSLVEISGGPRPVARTDANLLWIPGTNRFVLFSGSDNFERFATVIFDKLWELTLTKRAEGDYTGSWRLLEAKGPPPRGAAATVFHPYIDRSFMYGGLVDLHESFNDLWSWNDEEASWQRHSPQLPAMPPRFKAAVGAAASGVVIHGGQGANAPGLEDPLIDRSDTWLVAGGRTFSFEGRAPARASAHAMAYDPDRDRSVLFGGFFGSTGLEGQTWTWDGAGWTRWDLPGPSPRRGHAMAFDPVTRDVILFGGEDFLGQPLGDTWSFDGATWRELSPTTEPPARSEHDMARDGDAGVLMVGGSDPRTWRWDGSDWTDTGEVGPSGAVELAGLWQRGLVVATTTTAGVLQTWRWENDAWTQWTTGFGPRMDLLPTLASDATGMTAYAVGGGVDTFFGPVALNQLWTFDGASWTDESSNPLHPPAHEVAMAYTSTDAQMLLYGGSERSTWVYESTNWIDVTRLGPGPRSTDGHRMADVPEVGVFLFGGRDGATPLDEVWRYTRSEGWRSVAASNPPPARSRHAWAFHPEGLMAFGGDAPGGPLDDTWTFEPALGGWTLHSGVGPSARSGAAAAYAPSFGDVVLFGGRLADGSVDAETWTWDGSNWRRLTASGPPARAGGTLVYDPDRRALVLVGGIDDAGVVMNDVWTFDGSAWSPLPVEGLEARAFAAGAYHQARSDFVLYGGHDATGAWLDDSVSLPSAATTLPAMVFELDWPALGVERSQVVGLRVDLVAEGSSRDADGNPLEGLALEAWHTREARWATVDANIEGGPARQTIVARDDPESFLYDPLILRLRPRSERHSGLEPPRISVDALEVSLELDRSR